MSVLVPSVAALESVPEVDVSSAKTKFEPVSARPASSARSKLLFICSSEVMQRQTRAWPVFIWGTLA